MDDAFRAGLELAFTAWALVLAALVPMYVIRRIVGHS